MLEVDNGGMTTAEYRSHFSLCCILAAPLMAGNYFNFFFNDTATTEIYTLSLHDALPISVCERRQRDQAQLDRHGLGRSFAQPGWQTARVRRIGHPTGELVHPAGPVDCRSYHELETAKSNGDI